MASEAVKGGGGSELSAARKFSWSWRWCNHLVRTVDGMQLQ